MRKLIILYGGLSDKSNAKQQMMINGGATCGYREYAEAYGEIIYLCPQVVSKPFEKSMTSPGEIVDYCNSHPETIVWSVKHDPNKTEMLKLIKNRTLYYSCCANNMYCDSADISLVDSHSRVKDESRHKVWFKGKDSNKWLPSDNKRYDYLLMGRRGDKNELYFLDRLTKEISYSRSILWIGGEKFKDKVVSSHHDITFMPFSSEADVIKAIPTASVGVIYTEHRAEGFPQSFLEMAMCGVPVVYPTTAPINPYYVGQYNIHICQKKDLIFTCEMVLAQPKSELCRAESINKFDLDKSYKHMSEVIW